MSYVIGGEFGIKAEDFLKPVVTDLEFIFKGKHYINTDTGRSAIYLALKAIIEQGGLKEAWLPRFCCESVLKPFTQLGFQVHYYSMGEDLKSPDNLPAHLTGATFLFINYFGKKNTAIIDWLNIFPSKDDLFIIEDCVQSTLSDNVGNNGHFVVYGYRKILPQPDGAVLVYNKPINSDLDKPDEAFISEKIIGKVLRENNGEVNVFLDLLLKAENRINNSVRPREMSRVSQFLLERTDIKEVSLVRRSNWLYLKDLLKSLSPEIRLLFHELEEGEVPLGLPVKVEPSQRDNLRRFLFDYNIYCPVHWPLNGEQCISEFKSDFELSASILTLPIDQRLTKKALDYFAEKLCLFFKKETQ